MSQAQPQITNRREKTIYLRQLNSGHTHALLQLGNRYIPCQLGRTGSTAFKREGDGATPKARMKIKYGYYRPDKVKRPRAQIRLIPLHRDDGWCDDPTDGRYNRPIKRPFKASHEKMWRKDDVYDIVLVLDWNIRPRCLRRGSAIFFHLTQKGETPTAGCLAISKTKMERWLSHISPNTTVIVR